MFCATCGKADQTPGTYCRQCGNFLSDNAKVMKRGFGGDTPQDQIRTNLYLNFMSGVVSLVSSILLFIIFTGGDIYGKQQVGLAIAAFLMAMSGWQFSAFAVNLKLRKNLQQARKSHVENTLPAGIAGINNLETRDLLPATNFSDLVPPSVAENTTKHLGEKIRRKSS